MNRKSQVILILILYLGITIILYPTFKNVSIVLILVLCILTCCFIGFIITNRFVKKTNWYKNNFIFTTQFISNTGYRKNLQRNLEIVNLGSNPARFGFFYENIKGENWSTGTQGLDKDLEILKYYHSYIKEGGYILLPIVPFTSVSGYLTKDTESLQYRAKFIKILDSLQHKHIYNPKEVYRWIKYPLFYHKKALKYLIKDVKYDDRLNITNQLMQHTELIEDAKLWMSCWKKEFHIHDFRKPLNKDLLEGRKQAITMFKALLDFSIERGYKPIIISLPVSKELSKLITPDIKEIYIDSFVREFNNYNVPYLDYTYNDFFSNNALYQNALFMNLKGRKIFTKDVLKRIGIY